MGREGGCLKVEKGRDSLSDKKKKPSQEVVNPLRKKMTDMETPSRKRRVKEGVARGSWCMVTSVTFHLTHTHIRTKKK